MLKTGISQDWTITGVASTGQDYHKDWHIKGLGSTESITQKQKCGLRLGIISLTSHPLQDLLQNQPHAGEEKKALPDANLQHKIALQRIFTSITLNSILWRCLFQKKLSTSFGMEPLVMNLTAATTRRRQELLKERNKSRAEETKITLIASFLLSISNELQP